MDPGRGSGKDLDQEEERLQLEHLEWDLEQDLDLEKERLQLEQLEDLD